MNFTVHYSLVKLNFKELDSAMRFVNRFKFKAVIKDLLGRQVYSN